jgi:hypothetical protein
VEEDYKVLKLRVEVENWAGKSPLSIYQDFHAKVFTATLTAILAQPAQAVVAQQSQAKKYTYQVNWVQLLLSPTHGLVSQRLTSDHRWARVPVRHI